MSLFLNQEDGYYSLTNTATIVLIIIVVVLILLTAFFKSKGKNDTNVISETGSKPDSRSDYKSDSKTDSKAFSTKQLVFSAAAIALGFITSYIKVIDMPWGGSVTLCSMMFVTLIGYWYGIKAGLCAGFAYAILQFIQGGGDYILSPLQVCTDYLLAFASLGLSGFFHNKKNGLIKGYLLAIFIRGLFHTIGGYLYWMDYMPDSFPQSLAVIYPFAYNYSYIALEGIITVIILMLPPVKSAMSRVKQLAD